MHTQSLPPTDREETANGNGNAAKPQPIRAIDLDLLAKVNKRIGPTFSKADLARELGISDSTVSLWMNQKPNGDVASLEGKLRYWVETIDERVDLTRGIHPTGVTNRMIKIIKSIARTNDLGIITSRAGIGKTCGAKLYLNEDPMAVYLEAEYCHGSAACMIEDLWAASRFRKRKKGPRLANDVLVDGFKQSNRVILIDNCHTLTKGGLKWAYSFHNRTGCPVVLIGNPCVSEKILSLPDEDQFTTRTGQFRVVQIDGMAGAEELAGLLLDQYAPNIKQDLMEQAIMTCQKRGFARKLKKQIRLTTEILAGGLKDETVLKPMRERGMTEAQIAFDLAGMQLLSIQDERAAA